MLPRWRPPREINHLAGADPGHRNNGRLQLGSVVKEQVVLRQMLVCYESILAAESSSSCGSGWGSNMAYVAGDLALCYQQHRGPPLQKSARMEHPLRSGASGRLGHPAKFFLDT